MHILRIIIATLCITLSAWLSLASCRQTVASSNTPCTTDSQKVALTINAVHQAIGVDNMRRLAYANQPNTDGALSRNITAYFHVRFQLSISTLSIYAMLTQNTSELEKAVKTMEYSFSYLKPDGEFQLIVPTSLANMPPATEGDLASGTAFFLSSLGLALSSMQESSWFRTSAEAKPYRDRIERLRPRFELALKSFLNKRDILLKYDGQAPNRLLFDALAYQTLGTYLGNVTSTGFCRNLYTSRIGATNRARLFQRGWRI